MNMNYDFAYFLNKWTNVSISLFNYCWFILTEFFLNINWEEWFVLFYGWEIVESRFVGVWVTSGHSWISTHVDARIRLTGWGEFL